MRTTLTLDEDVAAAVRREVRRSGRAFKQVVNELLRAGLRARTAPPARPYRLEARSLGGVMPGIDLDRALRLADALEDEALAGELELRK
jgi:hypothetical protein